MPAFPRRSGFARAAFSAACLAAFAACSFEYGVEGPQDSGKPNITMKDVEFVRVRDGEPVVTIQAETAERYDKKRLMRLENLRFRQYGPEGASAGADGSGAAGKSGSVGAAGLAVVDIASGDADLDRGVRVLVPDEDLAIETKSLSWHDAAKRVTAPPEESVLIKKGDGSVFVGTGFSSDARAHSWVFSGGVSGSYVEEDDDSSGAGGEPAAEASSAGAGR